MFKPKAIYPTSIHHMTSIYTNDRTLDSQDRRSLNNNNNNNKQVISDHDQKVRKK